MSEWRCRCLLLGLLAIATPIAAAWAEPDWSDAASHDTAAAGLDSRLQARLSEAERLAASGDYTMARTVLDEARDVATAQTPAALDAVERVAAQIEFRRGRYAEAQTLHEGILARASERRDLPTVAQAETDLAVLHRRRSDLSEALSGFERALALYRQLNDRDGVAEVLTHIGLIRLNQGVYSTALESLRESLKLQQDGARAELDRTYHYLGLLYAGLREYETARSYLDRGLAEARRHANASREAPLLGSMARVANLHGAHSEALNIAIESERLADRLDSPPGRVFALIENGRAKLGLNRLAEAREVLERGAKIAEQIGQRGTLARYRGLLAEVALRQGRQADALALWEQVLPELTSGDDQPQLLATYRLMIPVLRDSGQWPRAVAIGLDSLALQEQISGLDMNRRVAVMETTYRAQEAERKIELLQRDLEIQALRLKQEEMRRSLALAVGASVMVLAGLMWLRYRESRRLGRELADSNAELRRHREALASANEELEKRAEALAHAASIDALTGIANRRAFVERFSVHWDDAMVRGSELAIALIDVDHFKRINDTAGHAVGDSVLCALATCLQSLLRAGTMLARWGGEEFVVLLPGASAEAAAGLGERLRAAVAAIRREDLPPVTISIGIASIGGRQLLRQEQLFDEADSALYRAKASGRNRVVTASSLSKP